MNRSYVVTGAARGVGRAIVERLAGDGHAVVVIDVDAAELGWVGDHAAAERLGAVVGSAGDGDVADAAADRAEALGRLSGWVNNAAVFRDASLHRDAPDSILRLIDANLAPVVVGCAVAVRRFRASGTGG